MDSEYLPADHGKCKWQEMYLHAFKERASLRATVETLRGALEAIAYKPFGDAEASYEEVLHLICVYAKAALSSFPKGAEKGSTP